MSYVRPKKFLGQHFLNDRNIAEKIVDALSPPHENEAILEIGPGMGVLTEFIIPKPYDHFFLIEIDRESIAWLKSHFSHEKMTIIEGDFLQTDLDKLTDSDITVIGNLPYNISSQIFFRILEYRHRVREVVCMIQREVADRICAPHGNKTYGILTVLLGAHYETKKLFKVPPGVFLPPPKVDSAVIKLTRREIPLTDCDEKLFKKIVKQAFQMRRKTLRNALKPIFLPIELTREPLFDKRAEQLSIEDFNHLTKLVQYWKK